jgi:polysaccharide export outer membrane protein
MKRRSNLRDLFRAMRTAPCFVFRESRLPTLPALRLALRLALFVALVFGFAEGLAYAQFSGPGVKSTNPNLNSESITTDPSILHPLSRSIHVNPGDLVTVHIFGALDYMPTVRVALDGTVQLPLIGIVSLRGLTIDQSENLIAQRLRSAGMYRDPQVTLQVTESSNGVITVSGEGHAVIPASSEHHLLEVLAAAGGLPISASHTITIDRPGVDKPIVVDLGNDPLHSQQINLPLYPGDTVILSRVGVVYMLGEFKIPGVIPIQQNSPLTLLQAAATAGGTLYDGKYNDMRIIRTINDRRSLVHVDIKRVMLGKDPDPLLQADDIVFLPTSAIKAAIVSGGLNLLVNVANLALISTHY